MFLQTFLSKLLHVKTFCYTFASAFENERNLKQNEIKYCSGSEKKEFFEKIYINRQLVEEASLTLFIMCRFG